jgi:hypothetical protein
MQRWRIRGDERSQHRTKRAAIIRDGMIFRDPKLAQAGMT